VEIELQSNQHDRIVWIFVRGGNEPIPGVNLEASAGPSKGAARQARRLVATTSLGKQVLQCSAPPKEMFSKRARKGRRSS
jgi:hypothetical protein